MADSCAVVASGFGCRVRRPDVSRDRSSAGAAAPASVVRTARSSRVRVAADRRGLVAARSQAVLRHLSQPAREDRRPGARRLGPRRTSGTDAETWEKVVRKIRTGMMPPSGAPPARARRARRASPRELEARLDRAAVAGANLETPALHRLNRTEYANAIRDLLALDVDVTTLLPADGSSEGFDNIAEALERLALAHPGLRVGGDEDQPPGRRRSHARAVPGHAIRRPAGWRRTVTSRACRSARAAACWFATRFRWMPNTSSA